MVYTLEAEEAMPWVQRHMQMLTVALVLKATKNNRVIRMQEQRETIWHTRYSTKENLSEGTDTVDRQKQQR